MADESTCGQLEDTTRYPEGSILKVINYRKVQGVDMCDIKVDYYKYCGLEDGTYFWMGTDYLGVICGYECGEVPVFPW